VRPGLRTNRILIVGAEQRPRVPLIESLPLIGGEPGGLHL
jgi:hypothetical protein